VLYETGFDGDFLGRKVLSEQLSELLERIETPLVIALDDEWGNGKTYFLKRWVGAHTKENSGIATTVYFDAFEHDYLSDPLVSIISAVSDRLPAKQKKIFEATKSLVFKLAKPAFGVALSALTFGAKQHLDDMGDAVVEALSSETKDFAEGLWTAEQERKDAVAAFKKLLSELTGEGRAPLVVVVDELDRCRPDYALSVLEIVKHFFSVPRVHFVLGVNGAALRSSVRSRYGADIDAERYLRKFINLSFALPRSAERSGRESVLDRYAIHLIQNMGVSQTIANRCVELIHIVEERREVTLRDIEKVFSKIALLPNPNAIEQKMVGWIDMLCVLIVSSVVDPVFHSKLLSGAVPIEELREFFNAPKTVTVEYLGEQTNRHYDRDRTYWLFSTIYCCGAHPPEQVSDGPSWAGEMGESFALHGRPRRPDAILRQIQATWVDLFRLTES
jgi:hypothetical protein